MAVLASKAWMPRKSRCSAPGGMVQVLPVGAVVFAAQDCAVGAGGPDNALADVVDAAEVGGGVGVEDLPLGGCTGGGEG